MINELRKITYRSLVDIHGKKSVAEMAIDRESEMISIVSKYTAQQSVQLTALRCGLALSILFNVVLLVVVSLIIGGN